MREMKTYLEMFPVAHATEVLELEIEKAYAEAELVAEDFTETAIAA